MNWYYIYPKLSKTPVCLNNEMLNSNDSLDLFKGIYIKFEFPLKFKQISGQKYTDVLNPIGPFMIVTNRLVDLLIQNNVTGWSTFEISAIDKLGNQINDYKGFSITGRSGEINYSKSQVITKRTVPNGPITEFYLGLNFNMEKWDGSDIFTTENTTYCIINQKVFELLKKNKISNLDYFDIALVETPLYMINHPVE